MVIGKDKETRTRGAKRGIKKKGWMEGTGREPKIKEEVKRSKNKKKGDMTEEAA